MPAVLCREEAITLWSERAKFEQCGLKLVSCNRTHPSLPVFIATTRFA